MIDINRIIGINMCAKEQAELWQLKEQIAKATHQLDADDLVLIGDTCCRGPEESTGYMLNSKLYKRTDDFIKLVKINFSAIGLTDVDCPKYVFVITQLVDDELRRELVKMAHINHYRHYRSQIHVFGIDLPEEELSFPHSSFRIRHSSLKQLPLQLSEVLNGKDRKEEAPNQ